jgi:hypothetical protein
MFDQGIVAVFGTSELVLNLVQEHHFLFSIVCQWWPGSASKNEYQENSCG